jgi:hypothetical protein
MVVNLSSESGRKTNPNVFVRAFRLVIYFNILSYSLFLLLPPRGLSSVYCSDYLLLSWTTCAILVLHPVVGCNFVLQYFTISLSNVFCILSTNAVNVVGWHNYQSINVIWIHMTKFIDYKNDKNCAFLS